MPPQAPSSRSLSVTTLSGVLCADTKCKRSLRNPAVVTPTARGKEATNPAPIHARAPLRSCRVPARKEPPEDGTASKLEASPCATPYSLTALFQKWLSHHPTAPGTRRCDMAEWLKFCTKLPYLPTPGRHRFLGAWEHNGTIFRSKVVPQLPGRPHTSKRYARAATQ